jgi:hypothetical protein
MPPSSRLTSVRKKEISHGFVIANVAGKATSGEEIFVTQRWAALLGEA